MFDTLNPALATGRQLEYLSVIQELNGDYGEAAKKLGISIETLTRSFRRWKEVQSKLGYAPGHFESGVAPGFTMGKVTIQRGPDGGVERTWERQHPGDAEREQMLRDFATELMAGVPPLAPVSLPKHTDDELMCVYPMGDPHFGMYAWAADAGADFDLNIADKLTRGAIDRLVTTAPPSDLAVLLNLGDMFHADNQSNQTSSGNQLDVDGRRPKVQQVGLMAMVYCIQRLLEKHRRVIVRNNRGNHDKETSYALSLMLSCWFKDNPRVQVDLSPAVMWYHRFGQVLIASTHGDSIKGKDILQVMAADRPEDWGQSRYRHCLVGHLHHADLKEYPGGLVEYFNTLAARDAWHQGQGYRAGRDMRLIVYHRQHGEIERHRCDVGMITH